MKLRAHLLPCASPPVSPAAAWARLRPWLWQLRRTSCCICFLLRPKTHRTTACSRLRAPLATTPGHADTRLALVEVQPLTGRRHQIRRHFKALAHPLIGDATHGKGPLNRALAAQVGLARLWLHALELSLPHPVTGVPLQLRADAGTEWTAWSAWAT